MATISRREKHRSWRAWLLVGCASLLWTALAAAATRVTIPELKEAPGRYVGQIVQLECYYDKESPIWVSALPNADDWIGFYVTDHLEKALTWSSEYYNLLFAPSAMRQTLRELRGGDKVTVIGEGFHYHSASLDGTGIHVQQILQGWGLSTKAIAAPSSPAVGVPGSAVSRMSPSEVPNTLSEPTQAFKKYTVTMNGKRYEGLRFGDRYNFGGIDFQVEQDQ